MIRLHTKTCLTKAGSARTPLDSRLLGNDTPSLGSVLREGRRLLFEQGLEEARLEAEVLLMRLMGISRAHLHSHLDDPVSKEDEAAYRAWLDRRAAREPLAYITGVREFFGLDFCVDRRVLIPRPETELLVEECLRFPGQGRTGPSAPTGDGGPSPLLADIGAGSGAIAVALASQLPDARIYATDISADALEVARMNCVRHGVQERVELRLGDLLEPLKEPVDLILANLPYIPDSVLPTLAPEVSIYEPRLALAGGEDGLDLVRRLLAQAPGRLRPGGRLLMEIESGQGTGAARAAADALPRSSIRIMRDLAGLERVLVIELAS